MVKKPAKINPKIIIATHKKYPMPKDDIYFPLHVGAALSEQDFGFPKDNTGKNISKKNPYYCELTGMFWAWKNLSASHIGLAHYRRHFSLRKTHSKNIEARLHSVLTGSELNELLQETDIILPKARHYYIENLYDHYVHTMHAEPLEITGEIIAKKYPDYLPEFEQLHHRRSAHMFNMFVMKKEIFDDYCTWIFDILGELEKRVDASKYDQFHARFYGRISERLLDVYIRTNHLEFREVPVIDIEKVNWFKKGGSFLLAKFTGKKYGKSF